MTSETRTLIELKDVASVEIKCPECKVNILFPIAEGFKLEAYCPQCHRPWFDGIKDKQTNIDVYPAVNSILAIAAELRKLNRPERTDIRTGVRLHIDTTPQAGANNDK
jgi:phage FluMu protein Com